MKAKINEQYTVDLLDLNFDQARMVKAGLKKLTIFAPHILSEYTDLLDNLSTIL